MPNPCEAPVRLKRTEAPVSPLIMGGFIEFIENCITGGVYDPGSPSADEKGIRLDVLEKAKALGPTILRWPGGTYVHTFHWMDSIGPLSDRKKRRNIIWGGIVDGAFGTCEFLEYCKKIGAEPMLSVNMASGTAEEAANWVEYVNGEPGTYYADLRAAHGYPEPFHVKYWCIGNECFAEPDLGAQHDPDIYIRDAWEFTKHMKLTDPSIKLVFVGNIADMAWNERILDALEPVCDYFSLHHYSDEGGRGEYGPFMATAAFERDMLRTQETVSRYSDRCRPFSMWYRFPRRENDIKLCIDEWNIWNSSPVPEEGNRYGLKMRYNWRDALWTAFCLNIFIRNARCVEIANLAQMVNVIAPIVTEGDCCWAQTTYHPLRLYRNFLKGRLVECSCDAPLLKTAGGELPMLDVSATCDEDGRVSLFAVNLDKAREAVLTLPEGMKAARRTTLTAPDFACVNSLEKECVSCESAEANALLLKPASINVIEIV